MKNEALMIRTIQQKDSKTFTIVWNDGMEYDYQLGDLQKQCPCANCVDETTGKRINRIVEDDVSAKRIVSVGRYALKIEFSKGCSMGIFSFDFLYHYGQRKK